MDFIIYNPNMLSLPENPSTPKAAQDVDTALEALMLLLVSLEHFRGSGLAPFSA